MRRSASDYRLGAIVGWCYVQRGGAVVVNHELTDKAGRCDSREMNGRGGTERGRPRGGDAR